jgi:hypothetical protein
MRLTVLAIASLMSFSAFAELNAKIDLSLRTKPLQYNGVLTGAYDGRLWGEVDRTKGMYGFYRVGAKLGGSPTAAAFVQVAPIAPVVFEVQKGTTYRFVKTKATDCDTYECLHRIDRTDYSLRLGGAYKEFILMSRFTWRDIQTEDGTKPVFLEFEAFHVAPGHYYRYFENMTMAGYKLDDLSSAGLLYIGGELTGSPSRFYSGYGYYNRKMEWGTLTAALGYYDNAGPAAVQDKLRGVSALVLLSRSFGETLALF